MRLGGIVAAVAAPLLLSACALPAEPTMACADGVSVHFPKGDAELDLDAVGKVLLTVSTLEACPRSRAIVTGHSDAGEVQSLAGTRAANVAAVITKNGIDGRRVVVLDGAAPRSGHREPDNRFVSISWK